MNDAGAASELIAKADVLEDEEASSDKAFDKPFDELLRTAADNAELDALDERNATIVIEGDGPLVGTIRSVNAAGARHAPACARARRP